MKKNYLFAVALVAAALTGCSQDELVDFNPEVKSGFTASLETVESRTVLDANNKVQWVASSDHVSLFEKVDINAKYQVSSVNDNGTAKLTYVSHIDKSDYQVLDQYYAVYPYNDNNTIATDGTITAPVPAAYTYKDKESCIASALMVARSDSKSLRFTNAQGIIRLKLNAKTPYTWGMIQSITFTSKANYLSGTATMSWNGTDTPVAVIDTDAEGKGQSLTINLDESLKKDLPSKQSGEYVEFYVPVVPTTFAEKDLTMVVTFANNKTYELKDIEKEIAIARKEIVTLRHTIGSDDFSADIEDEVVSDEVSNEAQLIKALKAGGKVTLLNDITLTETANIPEGVTVSLNLNGKTLTGGILAPNAVLTIENGTFKNENSAVSAIEINAGELTLDNVTIQSARHAVRIDGDVTATINGGTYQVGTYGGSNTNHAVNVSGDANVTINGGTFIGPKGTSADSGAAVNAQAGSTVTIKDGNFSGGKNNTLSAKGTLTVLGGTFDQDPSDYVAEGYKALEKDGKYYVVSSGVDNLIATVGDLVALGGTKVNGTYMLMADLDMSGYDMKPIQLTSGSEKTLTFIGNGHTISNLNLVQDYQNGMYVAGLFNILHSGAELNVKDLTLTNVTSTSDKYAAAVVAYNSTSLTINLNNVDVKKATVSAESVAALVCYSTGKVNLTDCDVSGLTLTGEKAEKIGAYIGTANESACVVTVTNCTNDTTYKYAGRVINGATMTIDNVPYVTNADGLSTSVANGATSVLLADGEYDMPNFGQGAVNGVKFIGESNTNTVIKLYNTTSGGDFCLDGSTATLENLKIVTEIKDWAGFQNAQKLTFNKCKFVNNLFLSGNAIFNECHFEVTTNHYNVWAYSANSRSYTADFNDCVFDCAGKSIYIDGNAGGSTTMNFTRCTFNDNDGGATDKAAIETGTTYGAGATYNVNIEDCEFNGFAIGKNTDSTIWANKNSMAADKLNIVLNGVELY